MIHILIQRQLNCTESQFLKKYLIALVLFAGIGFATKTGVLVTFEKTKLFLFAYCMCGIYVGLTNAFGLFYEEKVYVLYQIKEKLYDVGSYLVSRIVTQAIIVLGQTAISTLVFSWFGAEIDGLITPWIVTDFFITMFLTIFCATSLGLFVGLFVENITIALAVMPPILIVQMVFSETIIELPSFLKFFSNVVLAKHSISAFGSLLDINRLPTSISLSYPQIPQVPDELFEYTFSHIFTNLIYISVLAIVPLICSWFVLMYKVNKKV